MLVALALPAAAAPGQDLRVAGRVAVGGDGPAPLPLAGAWVLLHEVGMAAGQPVDSARSDADGRYRLRARRADTAALYLVSAEYRGITYFSQAILPREWRDTVPTLLVYDTSSIAPVLRVGQRHVVVRRGGDGGRGVLELVSLVNRGTRTRVSPDSVTPVWRGRLPAGSTGFQVGESDVSAQAVERRGDEVVVTAPIPPGQKQIVFTYALPAGAGELALPADQPIERMLVLLEDTAATLVEGPLTRRGVEVFDDAHFALFDGALPAGGRDLVFRFSRPGVTAETIAAVLAALAGVLLLAAALVLLRRRPAPAAAVLAPADATPEALAREIARLDAAFEAGDRSPAAEGAYRERRAALKARLAAALAAAGAHP